MLDVLYTFYDIRKNYLRIVDVRDTRFDTRKVCVRVIDALYTSFDNWKSYLRTVNVQDSRFDIRKGFELN